MGLGWVFFNMGLWEMGFDLVVRCEDAVILRGPRIASRLPGGVGSLERAGAAKI